MRLKPSYIFALAIIGVVVAYFVVKSVFLHPEAKGGQTNGGKPAASALADKPKPDPLVQVSLIPESERPFETVVRGRTQARRLVQVRSETSGNVARTPVLQGSYVRAGTILCQLNVDARQANVDQAKAMLKSKQLSQQASQNLAAKGYRSQTQVLQDQAGMDNAAAAVRQAEIGLNQVNIRAPFSGVFDHRDAEVGSYLSPGGSCGTMIELDPLLIVGDVAETDIGGITPGQSATAKLSTGETIVGRVRYVAHDADPATRTYRVEIEAANPGNRARAGLSADVRVKGGSSPAHLVPASALVLDALGRQGVRYVLDDNRVAFAVVRVLDETPDGVWVAGLHGPTRLITVGQGYVSEGQRVKVAAK
ncbi:MAG: efflux transporter periplasmic adaptor subunit [Caulobacter sp.]|nr:efflux transporter periplasmic adaptor subunit [Caulobacter sp.]